MWARQHLPLYLAKGLALNLEIKQPAIPVCTGISDSIGNLFSEIAEIQLEAKLSEAWTLQMRGS